MVPDTIRLQLTFKKQFVGNSAKNLHHGSQMFVAGQNENWTQFTGKLSGDAILLMK